METGHTLFHAVHQLSRQLTKYVNETLEPFGLFSAQWSVLFVLKTKGTMSQSELCEYLSVEAPPMTRNNEKLVKLNLVRHVLCSDKRTKQIELTEKALAEYPKWEQAIIRMNKRLVREFPPELQDQLHNLLNKWFKQLTK